jgi:very-short-patch-repair endonuclease
VIDRRQTEVELRHWLRNNHSVISLGEAMDLGASKNRVRNKLATGEWARLYRAVYRDTAARTTGYQALRAAYLATSGRGVVSHSSAAWAWGLLDQRPALPELSVLAGAHDIRRQGIIVHKSVDLDQSQSSSRAGIPVTNPLRTLVDLAGTAAPMQLAHAVDVAIAAQLVTVAGLLAELQRLARPGRPGIDALRRHLRARGFIGAPAPSVLESRMRRLVRTLRLPPPTVELRVGDNGEYRLDLAWPEIRLAVEVDGYIWHFSDQHKQRDDSRRNDLQEQGWTVLVFNWRQVSRDPAAVAAKITSLYTKLAR